MPFSVKLLPQKAPSLDIADFPDPPLITIFGKVANFNLTQATAILLSLIAIYGRSYLYGNYEKIFY